ncbi:unnamed protein product [Prorocentrum cordatum]|uniref:Uncharacterized protein n=1 Tax=Prorocentrum cordatum TaxID=2364126 RepID=A0ABN9VND7_9DINO|nr:unnamed protein product [Polarella glacialis]
MTAAAGNADHSATWFASVDEDACAGSGNLVCVKFDEAALGFVAGALAGLVTTSQVTGAVGALPIGPIKRFLIGYRMGVHRTCPDCKVESGTVNHFGHVENGVGIADWLRSTGADVVFGAGGYTGSVAIMRSASLGSHVIGVDTDEFEGTFANENASVRSMVLSSAMKKLDVTVELVVSLFLGIPTSDTVPEVVDGTLTLDYANGGVGLADCHLACTTIGAQKWSTATRLERSIGAGNVLVPMSPDNSYIHDTPLQSNSFEVAANSASPPSARTQFAMTTWSTLWKNHFVVFGGLGDSGVLNDLWLYEIDFAKWLPADHGLTTGSPPPPLQKSCAVSLGAFLERKVVIFGGKDENDQQSDKSYMFAGQPPFPWVADYADIHYEWTHLSSGGTPPAVEGPGCAAFNETCALVFGGRAFGGLTSDLDLLCLNNGVADWTNVWEASGGGNGPAKRERAAVAVVSGSAVGLSAENVLVVAGGIDSIANLWLTDVWAFSLSDLEWTALPTLPFEVQSTPLLFTAVPDGAVADVLVLQFTSDTESYGPGAMTLDLGKAIWSVQPGYFMSPPADGLELGAAVWTGVSTWLFGGQSSDGSASLGELYKADFAFKKDCPPGQESDGADCVDCPTGFFSLGGSGESCNQCPPGRAAPNPGTASCGLCDAGRFSGAGSANCTSCPAGTSTNNGRGESECSNCASGQYAGVPGQAACTLCELGRYVSATGSSECNACEGDLTTAYPGTPSIDLCVCAEDSYRPVQAGSINRSDCEPCPSGMTCATGSDMIFMPGSSAEIAGGTIPLVDEGYYTTFHEPLSVYLCGQSSHCIGGLPETCAGSRSGLNCAICPEGTSPGNPGCDTCPASTFALFIVAVIVALVVVPVGLYYWGNSVVSTRTSTFLGASLAAGIIVTVAQVFGTFSRLTVPWPTSVGNTLSGFSILMFDPRSVGVECVLGSDGVNDYIFQAIAPFVMIVVFLALYFGSRLLPLIGQPAWESDKVLNSVGAFFQVVFIALVGVSMVPLQCYSHPNGEKSIVMYPEFLCGQDEHTTLVAFGIVVFLFVVLPALALHIWATIKATSSTLRIGANAALLVRFRFVFYRFRPDVWWWGNVYMIRQLLLAMGPIVQPDDPNFQVIFVVATLSFYVALLCAYWPWKTPELNLLDCISSLMLSLIVVSVSSFMPKSDWDGEHLGLMWTMLSFVFVLNVAMMLFVIFSMFSKGPTGLFGFRYPREKIMLEFAQEWAALCKLHTTFDVGATAEWLESMNDYDRQAIDRAISVSQAYGIAGTRTIISTKSIPRVVLDKAELKRLSQMPSALDAVPASNLKTEDPELEGPALAGSDGNDVPDEEA